MDIDDKNKQSLEAMPKLELDEDIPSEKSEDIILVEENLTDR